MAEIIYLLCGATSLLCVVLLVRSWRRTSHRLLFWSSLCFVGLALNNALLFIDLAILQDSVDLSIARSVAGLLGLLLLVGGLVWDSN